jgi:hypothetical protein
MFRFFSKSGRTLAPLVGRVVGMVAKVAFVPLALARLSNEEIPLYFLVLSITAYVGLADTGLLAASHGMLARFISAGRWGAAAAYCSKVSADLWFRAALIAGIVLPGAALVGLFQPELTSSSWVVAVAVCLSGVLIPLRLSTPLSFASKEESRLVFHEAVGQVLALLLVIAAPHFGYVRLSVLELMGISMGSQILAYGSLLLHHRRRFEGTVQEPLGLDDRGIERYRLFGCSLIESILLYGDTLAVTLLVSADLTSKVGFAVSIWLQAMMLTNILLIRVWTSAAVKPGAGLIEVLRTSGHDLNAVIGIIGMTAAGLGFGLPVISSAWTQGRIALSFDESWILAGYYLVSVICTLLSFYLKGAGRVRSRLHILLVVLVGRFLGMGLCWFAGPGHVGYLEWFAMLMLVSVLFDIGPMALLLKYSARKPQNELPLA